MMILAQRLEDVFELRAKSDLKKRSVRNDIENSIRDELKYAIFQMERLSNLTKVQRVGQIYLSPIKTKILEFLRKGPISRNKLFNELSKYSDDLNLDLALKPFLELNILRRDWAKGTRDKKTGIVEGEGEYLFLTKDIYLVRKPATNIIKNMSDNDEYGNQYLTQVNEFYAEYDPFANYNEDGAIMGKVLLNPDSYDLISLLASQSYQREKMPKILSSFSKPEKLIRELIESKILTTVTTIKTKREILCVLCEIAPLLTFPEYLMNKVQDRLYQIKEEKGEGMILEDKLEEEPLTLELAVMALDKLQFSYEEKIDF
jgi:hypothetical protein